nr:MAG TPA: hypothetical protein [Caudoviricetes sp.]
MSVRSVWKPLPFIRFFRDDMYLPMPRIPS